MNYYNENDAFAVQWLGELMTERLIPAGRIDERGIQNVSSCDVQEYTQCHFFAGIGGWIEALRIAQWPSDVPVWTGSCPCQPLSVAGTGGGAEDERHLWPEFARLICQCRPPVVLGEQVASKLGREWLSGVRADLEAMGYAVGAADLCAACAGSPQIRQRLFWVAYAPGERWFRERLLLLCRQKEVVETSRGRKTDRVSDTHGQRCQMQWNRKPNAPQFQSPELHRAGNHWDDAVIIPRKDGKFCRIPSEPGLFPVVDGFPYRVDALRGAGNAIVPQIAAEFIRAFMQTKTGK